MKCKYHSCQNQAGLYYPKNQPQGVQRVFCSEKCKNKHNVDKCRWLVKLKAIAFLGGKCSRCGYNKSPQALEFHHKDRATKSFNLGIPHTRSWTKVQEEIKKCELLCANCHREVESSLLVHKQDFFREVFSEFLSVNAK